MRYERRFELALFVLFFLFSAWLMNKSFGYNASAHTFRIARHQVGDFGLHLSLMRSFSWGNNFPPEHPDYPGRPLPYHYGLDFVVGILERIGIPIDLALNGLSTISFAFLLYMIYKLSKILFLGRWVGVIAVILFIFHSNLTFIDFLKGKSLFLNLVKDLWRMPDYIHKGPFDGSLISIFFTLNVYLNQRHLIVSLAIGLTLIYFFLNKIRLNKDIMLIQLIFLGFMFGLTSRIHSLIFFSTSIVIFLLFIFFRRLKWVVPLFSFTLFSFLPHAAQITSQKNGVSESIIYLGFLASRPLTAVSFLWFWFVNTWIAFFLIPLGFLTSNSFQKKVFIAFFSLFLVGNTIKLGFRIDHNHALFNYFLIIANIYIAYFLIQIWQCKNLRKFIAITLFILLTVSGFIDFMVIKNDFQYYVLDAPANPFIQWIWQKTPREAIFLSPQNLYDPVTLAGRKNYLGATYYLEVMGYDINYRRRLTQEFFEVSNVMILDKMRSMNISYIVIPMGKVDNFPYIINREFLNRSLSVVYKDKSVMVYKL